MALCLAWLVESSDLFSAWCFLGNDEQDLHYSCSLLLFAGMMERVRELFGAAPMNFLEPF